MSLTPTLVVAQEEYSPSRPVAENDLPALAKLFDQSSLISAGWRLLNARTTRLRITFVDGAAADPPLAQMIGSPGARRLTPVADVSTRAYWLEFVRRRETLFVEVADIHDSLANEWVRANQAQHEIIEFPNGLGFIAGPSAALDTGHAFIRALWGDGAPMGNRPAEIARRTQVHVANAQGILRILGAGAL
jgi:hypothetical protein